MEHAYTPAIVGRHSVPSRFVQLKAFLRNVRPTVTGTSNGVMHWLVPSYSRPFQDHRVEYDGGNKTFRCSCEAGFYGMHCHHIESIVQKVRLT